MKLIISELQLKRIVNIITEDASDIDSYSDLDAAKNNRVPFTPANFGKAIKKVGIKYPDIAIAQSLIETGNFTSHIFKDNNNLFGMQHPEKRSTLSLGVKNGHAYYKSWIDSVKDYKLWQDSRPKLASLDKQRYLMALNKIYCHPPECGLDNYARKVRSLLGDAMGILSGKGQPQNVATVKAPEPGKSKQVPKAIYTGPKSN